ncbi:MAG: DUF2723 domain-containing protein [Bacteroidetes bacterium]|nr:DUF2723 domain-containing protein [Bacteroidota bacterium]
MTFKKWNTYLGWSVFLIATIVYFITIEDTVSLWDCGEYITAAYKLEVGHPPGAPLFMVLGRLFSFFASPENVAVWINRLSALCSSLTILFMFWSITMIGRKIIQIRRPQITTGDKVAILASAFVGSLAYTFSESFWFSAVEGEVYAMSSLFTAIIFWAGLKWDEEMGQKHRELLAPGVIPNRWLLLIMFLLGLAIGVHLLGILVVPAICYIIYFQFKKDVTPKGLVLVGLLSVVILGFIQEAIIPGTIALASSIEVIFRNSIGLPFYSGTVFFFALVAGGAVYFIRRFRKSGNDLGYNITMGLIMLLIGYGSFAVIVIRSNANTPLDENDPENLVTLHAYLKREQYGSSPLLFGPYWNSKTNPRAEWKDRSAFYLRRFVVVKGDQNTKAFQDEKAANEYAAEIGGGAFVDEKYFESNENDRLMGTPTYAQTTFFPRMYYSAGPGETAKIEGYKNWSGYDPTDGSGSELGSDNERLPTFGENMTYFFRYQVNWMYWRYFLWNFAGRQNDIQGHGDQMRGNWISGFSFIDDMRLGNQSKFAPYYTSENPSNNKFFLFPLILGLIGLIFHFYRAPKNAFVLTLVFLFTGLAIVLYLNQKPLEPRERDYAYAGSFYFFAMWIGLGVLALYDAFTSFGKAEWKKIGILAAIGLAFFFMIDGGADVSKPNTITWLVVAAIGGGLIAIMQGLKKVLKSDTQGAIIAGLFGLFVPIIMGMQGWDDHDRSEKSTAHDLAYNYLNGCTPNGILYTNGDNDTFPLWYMQEVEGVRTDVRVCNLSLMQTDWYTNQMKMKAYESDPLPIKFREDQIMMYAGNTDQVYFLDLLDLYFNGATQDIKDNIITMRLKNNEVAAENAIMALRNKMNGLLSSFTAGETAQPGRLELLKNAATGGVGNSLNERINSIFTASVEMLSGIQQGAVKVSSQDQVQVLQTTLQEFETSWNYTDLNEAMEFVRNDNNMLASQGNIPLRVFPSKGFTLKVNKENAVASGVLAKKDKGLAADQIQFIFSARGLSREQVMMLDVMANNDWKRGIFYSSPGASDVAMALYRRNLLKQNGLVYELTPVQGNGSPVDTDKMYDNLLNNFKFGAMNKEGVLTDYYARRHTTQYRQAFEALADTYMRNAEEAEQIKSRGPSLIEMYRNSNQTSEAERMDKILKNADKIIAESKKKAADVIRYSVKIMPVNLVFDHGEPSMSNVKYPYNGIEVPGYSDGSLHHYVELLYRAGAKADANKLADQLSAQLESIINYYTHSNPRIALKSSNAEDLFAALDSYFTITQAAINAEFGDPKGKTAIRLKSNIDKWYNIEFPAMMAKAKQSITDSGESLRRSNSAGPFARAYFNAEDYLDAMAIYYGIKKAANNNGGQSLESLMNGPQ